MVVDRYSSRFARRTVEPQNAATAGMFGAASLITGICSGIIFSMFLPKFVANVAWDI
jgi:equilibrative nucleoside transporter 1/2/3